MVYSILECFMLGFLLGAFYGIVYEALRIVRLILRFDAAVIMCDIAFFVLAAQGVFKLSLILGNYVRIYTVLGFAAGVFAYITTIGRVFNAIETAMAILWRKTLGKIINAFIAIIKKSFGAFAQFGSNCFRKVADFLLGIEKNAFRLLHSHSKKLYNKESLMRGSVNANVIKARVEKKQ